MRRLLLGLLLGALVFGVSFAGAKIATVTNPMSADLDANGHSLLNVWDISSEGLTATLGTQQTSVFPGGVTLGDWTAGNYTVADVLVGAADPSAAPGVLAGRASIYLRDTGATGQAWVKVGPLATEWRQLAFAP